MSHIKERGNPYAAVEEAYSMLPTNVTKGEQKDGYLVGYCAHLSIHNEPNGPLLSLWDTEEQARRAGVYVRLEFTEEQVKQLAEGCAYATATPGPKVVR